jgi:CrcB protein
MAKFRPTQRLVRSKPVPSFPILLKQLILLAAAGALGTLARYGIYLGMQRLPWSNLPIATLIVNVLGSFLFGVVWPLAEQGRLTPQSRLLILTGFMGAFTTFSTLAFESGQMLRDSQWGLAAANLMANNVLGIAALFLGMALVSRS